MTSSMDASIRGDTMAEAPGKPLRLALFALACLVAIVLGWKAWEVNIRLSCWKDEWPHLPVCDDINGRTAQERRDRLQERVARNPGDAQARVALAVLAHGENMGTPEERSALLDRAIEVAPQHPDVLQLQAVRALDKQQWPQALDPLLRLSQHHANTPATQTLVQLIQAAPGVPPLADALRQAVRTDARWLDRVLRAMPGMKVPVGQAWPLLSEAMSHHRLDARLGQFVTGRLKAEGRWIEAQGVWLHLWNRPMPLLFNGDFERDFIAQGFDWEVAGPNDHRAGALVELVGRGNRGRVLRVSFGGKGFRSPVIRHHMVLPPGRYRLQGDWQSSNLHSAQGLSWVVSCLGGPGGKARELARSQALNATGRDWKTWQLDLDVPVSDCGPGLQLALQPQAAYEARAGMQGEIVFDAMRLETITD